MHFFNTFFVEKFGISEKSSTFAPAFEKEVCGLLHFAAIAQLVEHDLAKVGVASSSLVCRSHEEQDSVPAFLL